MLIITIGESRLKALLIDTSEGLRKDDNRSFNKTLLPAYKASILIILHGWSVYIFHVSNLEEAFGVSSPHLGTCIDKANTLLP